MVSLTYRSGYSKGGKISETQPFPFTYSKIIRCPHKTKILGDPKQRNLMFLPYLDTSLSESLVPLKKLLTLTDVAINTKGMSVKNDIEGYNIGSLRRPKVIKLSKTLPLHTKIKYLR